MSKPEPVHTEKTFEQAIQDSLTEPGGYELGDPSQYDADKAIFPQDIIAFLKDSQPENWQKLEEIYGAQVEGSVVSTIVRALDQQGMLHVLRKGVTDRGVKLRLAFFKPSTKMNEETLALYDKNVLKITRQVHQSVKEPEQSVDVVLSLNGLPVATAELKNPLTGQTFQNALKQYKDRNPNDPLFRFKHRALVHFAVDPDQVFMTTHIKSKSTFFLPFNKGNGMGAGNPLNPNGYKTAYLWEDVWSKDRWLEILQRFIHLEISEKILPNGKIRKSEVMIFPRYHQLDVVTKMLSTVKREGVGKSLLVQHSAGSGKSNSIAWLAHRLSSLHNDKDENIFDTIIVITDRRVLDKQLQDNIYQMDHVQGVIECIKEGTSESKSQQLTDALQSGKRIIITTIQTFPHVIGQVDSLANKKFAIIADEAHSSQTGETAKKLKQVLKSKTLEEAEKEEAKQGSKEDETDKVINEIMSSHGHQKNMSFFAFTATPKHKTLELFGEKDANGEPAPFHLYSMRQAIEEGFILDVLNNYMTYKTYFNLQKAIDDDPEVDKNKAKRAMTRYVSLHPHNLTQKTEIIVEHFRNYTRHKIGGKAKAMVVTRSRLHAVRYKREFDRYIKGKGYDDMKALVAFSGTVIDPDSKEEYTETAMNGFGERELPDKFDTDDYQVLLVAEKYQTGFDQPLLHTMYVDKKLKDLQAVQTLSRLNRCCGGKEDTFVLDFENDVLDIQDAFKPYYQLTEIDQPTDPNQIYMLRDQLNQYQYYYAQDIEAFAKVFFKPPEKQKPQDQGKLNAILDPAIERFKAEPDEDRQEEFRHQLVSFIRLYSFLCQVVDYGDKDLEKLYAFGRLLRTKLPKRDDGGIINLDDDVELEYYRNDKTFEGSASLSEEDVMPVMGTGLGSAKPTEEDTSPLSEIIEIINDRFNTNWNEGDKIILEQMVEDLMTDDILTEQARVNTFDTFKNAGEKKAMDVFIARTERNGYVSSELLKNKEMREFAFEMVLQDLYERVQKHENEKEKYSLVHLDTKRPLEDRIASGEGEYLEFKSTLRVNIHTGKKDAKMENAALKTIAGFLNKKGGFLIVGVNDDGEVLGLDNDKFQNEDKMLLHLGNLINDRMGSQTSAYINSRIEDVSGGRVLVVECHPSKAPVYIKESGTEKFYVRTTAATTDMSISEAQAYIKDRFI